jgi:hypothetical protein
MKEGSYFTWLHHIGGVIADYKKENLAMLTSRERMIQIKSRRPSLQSNTNSGISLELTGNSKIYNKSPTDIPSPEPSPPFRILTPALDSKPNSPVRHFHPYRRRSSSANSDVSIAFSDQSTALESPYNSGASSAMLISNTSSALQKKVTLPSIIEFQQTVNSMRRRASCYK